LKFNKKKKMSLLKKILGLFGVSGECEFKEDCAHYSKQDLYCNDESGVGCGTYEYKISNRRN
jgi:hypothetical protein